MYCTSKLFFVFICSKQSLAHSFLLPIDIAMGMLREHVALWTHFSESIILCFLEHNLFFVETAITCLSLVVCSTAVYTTWVAGWKGFPYSRIQSIIIHVITLNVDNIGICPPYSIDFFELLPFGMHVWFISVYNTVCNFVTCFLASTYWRGWNM